MRVACRNGRHNLDCKPHFVHNGRVLDIPEICLVLNNLSTDSCIPSDVLLLILLGWLFLLELFCTKNKIMNVFESVQSLFLRKRIAVDKIGSLSELMRAGMVKTTIGLT